MRTFAREFGVVITAVITASVVHLVLLGKQQQKETLDHIKDVISDADDMRAAAGRVGLEDILLRRNELGLPDLLPLFKQAEQIELLGASHMEIIPDPKFLEVLKTHLAEKKLCRILLLDPNGQECKRRETVSPRPAPRYGPLRGVRERAPRSRADLF